VDEPINIISRKFDGRISKSWQAELIERRDDLLIVKGLFDLDVNHRKLGFIKRGTVSYEFYWPERWYNVFRFHEPEGNLRSYYCNIATPPTFENGTLDYIDLDIDVLADPDLNYEVLDLEEFEERTVKLGYTNEILERSRRSLNELIALIENHQFPFDYKN
jgi:protein associated with RNAse G/E